MRSNTQQSVAELSSQVQGLQQELAAAQLHSVDLQQVAFLHTALNAHQGFGFRV